MMNPPDDNPYSPPVVVGSSSAPKPSIPVRHAVLLNAILFVCGLVLAFCIFWFVAAVYEIATLQDDAYGPHTWRFRNSYIRAAVMSFAIGGLSLCGLVWFRRRLRGGG